MLFQYLEFSRWSCICSNNFGQMGSSHLRKMFRLHRNTSIDFHCKSIYWFLHTWKINRICVIVCFEHVSDIDLVFFWGSENSGDYQKWDDEYTNLFELFKVRVRYFFGGKYISNWLTFTLIVKISEKQKISMLGHYSEFYLYCSAKKKNTLCF